MAFETKLFVIRARATHETEERSPAVLLSELFASDDRLQRHADARAGRMNIIPTWRDPAMETALALVHSRFSTNTFPSWDRGHPYRYIAHNGEINTLRGNINWMHARAGACSSPSCSATTSRRSCRSSTPTAATRRCSITAWNCWCSAGRSLAARDDDDDSRAVGESREHERREEGVLRISCCLMEPWDGPASIAFTDGKLIGAVLDRNGLRPSRYYVTKDDLVIMASEVGVLDIRAGAHSAKGPSAAGPHVPGRHRARPHRRRRRDQEQDRDGASVSRMAR